LFSNLTNAEYNGTANSDGVAAFNSNGFRVLAGTNKDNYNSTGQNYVAWQWRANGTPAVSNTNGTITSTVSANTSAGFSIVTYTGTGSSGATVGHGLGVTPAMLIVKRRNSADGWFVYNHIFSGTDYMILNSTNGNAATSGVWNNTNANSSVFTLGNNTGVNGSGGTYVAYCFATVAGYSAFGKYTGNGSTDGTFVFCGFRPRYILIKRTDAGGFDWYILDTARNPYNQLGNWLITNGDRSEGTTTELAIDFLSNGFKPRNTGAWYNANGGTYIFAAFAESPFKYANAR
jgi:hypothetical protein